MSSPLREDEVAIHVAIKALKNPRRAEKTIKDAIMALPKEERDAAGGKRVDESDRDRLATTWHVNKDFLAKLVLDGVVETRGEDAGTWVGHLISDGGLASKVPKEPNR